MLALDPQKVALYAWEEGWGDWNRTTLTMPQVRRWVGRACRKYGVKPPAVTAHKGKMWTTYDPATAGVTFERTQRNIPVALHEAAHHILYTLTEEEGVDEFEDHGKEFLGVFIWLLNEFAVAPLIALTASAKDAGLRFIPVRVSAPEPFRRRVAKAPS